MSASGTIDDRGLANGAVKTPEIADGALSADAAGLGKMAAGFFAASAAARGKFATDLFDATTVADVFALDSIDSAQFIAGSIDGEHLSVDAKQIALQSKLQAGWVQFSAFSATGASDDCTTPIQAAAGVGTPTASGAVKGILSTSTTLTSATGTENYKAQVRLNATKQPQDDGAGGEVYAVLSFAAAVWTATYYKADGTSYAAFAATSIDVLFGEVFDLDSLPVTILLTGQTFGDISDIAASHTHPLSEVSDVTSTAAELNKLDGASANVTAVNLNALTGGGDTALHTHDARYFTETELGNAVDATAGAKLIGIDASVIGPNAGAVDTVYGVLDALEAAIAAITNSQDQVDTFTGEAVTGANTVLNAGGAVLSQTPATPANVQGFMDSLHVVNGTHFSVGGTGNTRVTWLALGSGLNLLVGDNLYFYYDF